MENIGIHLDYSSIEIEDELNRADSNQHAIERRKRRERERRKRTERLHGSWTSL
jgi:hypothetical protein